MKSGSFFWGGGGTHNVLSDFPVPEHLTRVDVWSISPPPIFPPLWPQRSEKDVKWPVATAHDDTRPFFFTFAVGNFFPSLSLYISYIIHLLLIRWRSEARGGRIGQAQICTILLSTAEEVNQEPPGKDFTYLKSIKKMNCVMLCGTIKFLFWRRNRGLNSPDSIKLLPTARIDYMGRKKK